MVTIHSFTEAGGHAVNEDAFCIQRHPLTADSWICVLADGQGGQRGGGAAAALAAQTTLSEALEIKSDRLIDPSIWSTVLSRVDRAVERDREAGYTTLVGLFLTDDCIVGASCGDSAVLLASADQTNVLTSNQSKNPPVGSGFVSIVPFTEKLQSPWRLLVISDGVWKYAGWPHVMDAAKRYGGLPLLGHLQQLARLPGSGRFQDDFTIVLLEQD